MIQSLTNLVADIALYYEHYYLLNNNDKKQKASNTSSVMERLNFRTNDFVRSELYHSTLPFCSLLNDTTHLLEVVMTNWH
jgi:hypothetical protein